MGGDRAIGSERTSVTHWMNQEKPEKFLFFDRSFSYFRFALNTN
ncbi:MAG: hypothetical protein SVX43_20710 [Cyanobacteriota bacterium]|nr:hypothetical protein [Cyanobacteriota bacterium]